MDDLPKSYEDEIKQLIEDGSDINAKDSHGSTFLHKCAKIGDIRGIKLLLENKADFTAIDDENRIPLHYAVLYGYKKIVKLFINQITINSKDRAGFTPLHFAAFCDDTELMRLLIENGAEVNEKDFQEHRTPLHLAAISCNSCRNIKILLEKGAEIELQDVNLNTPLFLAVKNNKMKVIEYLIKSGSNIEMRDSEGNTVLFFIDQVKVAKLIINRYRKNKDKLMNFISLINKHGLDALDYAVYHNNKNVAKFLKAKTGNIKPDRLSQAIYTGNLEAVKLLLELGADVNSMDEDRNNPLHIAAGAGYMQIVKFFLKVISSINNRNLSGYTPLHFAIQNNHFDITKILIENHADLSIECNNNLTPIDLFINEHFEEVRGNKELIGFFIYHINKQEKEYKKKLKLSFFLPLLIKSNRRKMNIYKTIKNKLKSLVLTF
ncbi:ankyrin repeat domain-containing protein [Wolbachia endosymbiont of Pentidionis agamae]|uniref:ankyrin repeat domain-containing protein n=1 Tax=Wolbachia endosymbiont of Pentidionis agamae TaxID=3110435 RepID=UPI002FD5B917